MTTPEKTPAQVAANHPLSNYKTTIMGVAAGGALMSGGFEVDDPFSWLRLIGAIASLLAGFFSKDAK